jgi:ATP synthase protein I
MAEGETDEVPKLPPDARLKSLDERLDRLQQEEARTAEARQPDRTRQFGQKLAAQMVGMPVAGFLFGWLLDAVFKTVPLFMILGLFVGFGAGIANVYRWTKRPPIDNEQSDQR